MNILLLLNIYITQNSNTCLQGSPGLPGRNGVNGHNELPGRDDRDGAKGEEGVARTPGSRGGKGKMGASGTDTDHRNWKQCAWKNYYNRDIGLIKASWLEKRRMTGLIALRGSSPLSSRAPHYWPFFQLGSLIPGRGEHVRGTKKWFHIKIKLL